ncbi:MULTISPECIES: efflux RND transporter permease subunit [unclassified Pseudoalteromonas]|uniref:efflux RND transporter permease subunit n=1 Tax=unclassified Pseudoalteromonas TaxID=194690 RepID=UPI0020977EAD|nr:efflux RND transporter permease subunit [Pseudoalteromonas sp. XMcav2-N]MCO7190721.1 efflux RND transporter permease subunit [Pseudoalteromonas sp. XMcav2-N]
MNKQGLAHKLFVDKVISTLLLAILLVGGVLAYSGMLKENYPDLEIPQAIITVEWPGAAAEQVEKEITKPLEDALNGLQGLKKLQSGSQFSYAVIAVEFKSDEPMNEAMQRLRAKVDEGKAEFPGAVKTPLIEQVSVNDTPIIEFMLYGSLDDTSFSLVVKTIEKRLEAKPGVKKVDKGGYRETVVHVRMLPDRLRSLKISPNLVRQRIEEANLDTSWGEYDDGHRIHRLYLAGRFDDIRALQQLPIARLSDNRLIRLEEVALVYKGLDKVKSETYFSELGEPFTQGVSLGVKKRPGVDTITLINEVKAAMAEYQKQGFWPEGLKVQIISDESALIDESFANVFSNIWQAMLAVFIILMVLLTWREALIAGAAIPLTFLGALMILGLFGYTLNTMMIIGMVLALGMLVDVFILVMEGMHDNLYSKRLSFKEAALATVKTYAMPAFSGQLTTILAMAPMMAIGGVDGKFIRLIPITAVLCLVLSYLIAFVICIPLSQYLLSNAKQAQMSKVDKLTQVAGQRLQLWLNRFALRSRRLAGTWVAGSVIVWLISIGLMSSLPSLLYPKADGRNLAITIELGPDATLAQSRSVAERAGAYLATLPYFENVTMYVGKKSPRAISSISDQLLLNENPNLVGFSALFVPKDERTQLAYEYVPELRAGLNEALADVAGITVLFTPEVGGSSNDDPVQIVLSGSDMAQLSAYASQVQQQLATINGVTDVRNNLGAWQSQVRLTANREALNFHGITEQDFASQLRLATEADEYGKFKLAGTEDDLKIRLSTYWESRDEDIGGPKSMAEISLISLFTPEGELVPGGNLVEYEIDAVPPLYTHAQTQRAITIKAKVEGITVGEVIAQLDPHLQAWQQTWPEGYGYSYAGEAENAEETYGSAGVVFVLAIMMVFAVLTLALGSFKQPLVVLFTIPLALIGTFSGFWVFQIPFSFPAMIGLIALVGIVVNNAIVMLDTINSHIKAGVGLRDACARGAADRLRPIIGTSITTIVGLVPLGLSDPTWFPLCFAIIFGLLASTLVAMIVIPAMYMLVSRPLSDKPV